MQNEYYQIVVLTLALLILITFLYITIKILKAMNARPDIVALLAAFVIACGFIGLATPDVISTAKSVLIIAVGCFTLLLAAFTYRRSGGAS